MAVACMLIEAGGFVVEKGMESRPELG